MTRIHHYRVMQNNFTALKILCFLWLWYLPLTFNSFSYWVFIHWFFGFFPSRNDRLDDWSNKKNSGTIIFIKAYSEVIHAVGEEGRWHRRWSTCALQPPLGGAESSQGRAPRCRLFLWTLTLPWLRPFALSTWRWILQIISCPCQQVCCMFQTTAERAVIPKFENSTVYKDLNLQTKFNLLLRIQCFPPWRSHPFGE